VDQVVSRLALQTRDPLVFLDALVVKIREGGTVQRRACYLALGVTVEGERDVLGMWFQESEGAKFWMQVLSELKQSGVSDILLTQAWLNAWEYVTPFLAFPGELRRALTSAR
jgi:transposase-like protein